MTMRVRVTVMMIVMSLFLSTFLTAGPKVKTLTELTKPDAMLAKNGKLYVLERTSIYIYSLNDLKLLKKFGRAGEGPGEFMARPFGPPMTISFFEKYLVVNSNNRMSYFTLDGKFVREEKSPPLSVSLRVKGGYLTIGPVLSSDKKNFLGFKRFDEKFENPKVLYQTEYEVGNIQTFLLPTNPLNYYPLDDDNIFIINGKKGFVIDRFDHTGKKLGTIEKKGAERIKVPSNYKKEVLEWFARSPIYKGFIERIKQGLIIKEYYPEIKTMMIDKGNLYVMTNKTKKGLYEFKILDKKGKELKQAFVPLQEEEPYTYYPLLCCVENGTYYAFLENEDEESWDLHVKKIY